MNHIIQNYKLAWWTCAMVVFLGMGLLAGFGVLQRQISLSGHKEILQTIAEEKTLLIDTFLASEKEKLEFLGTVNPFYELVKNPALPENVTAANNRIQELKSMMPGISILTAEGIVLTGDIDQPGMDYSTQPYFSLPEKKIIFERYYDSVRQHDYFAVVGPIYDRTEQRTIIGTIAFDVGMEKLGALMKESVEGKTNEVYLIDQNGTMLSGSEFIDQANNNGVLIQAVKSEGAKDCLAHLQKLGKDGIVEEYEEEIEAYTNYMGDRVYGAHAYAKQFMGCVLAEEGADEIEGFSIFKYLHQIF